MAKLPQITNELWNEVRMWHNLARHLGRSFSWKRNDHTHRPDKMFTEEYNRKMAECEQELAKMYKVDCVLALNVENNQTLLIDDKFMQVSYRETKEGEKILSLFINRVRFKDPDQPYTYHGNITERYDFDGSDISWLTDLFGKPETAM